jgi:regulator of replication initiation timing
MREIIAEISSSVATVYAACAAAAASTLTAFFAWLKFRDGNKHTAAQQEKALTAAEVIRERTAQAETIAKLWERVGALEGALDAMRIQVVELLRQNTDAAKENARLNEENRHLRNAEDRVKEVRDEKHAIANQVQGLCLTVVYLKNELNKEDEKAGRSPRFSHPELPELEDDE